jgi:hypothetical protein
MYCAVLLLYDSVFLYVLLRNWFYNRASTGAGAFLAGITQRDSLPTFTQQQPTGRGFASISAWNSVNRPEKKRWKLYEPYLTLIVAVQVRAFKNHSGTAADRSCWDFLGLCTLGLGYPLLLKALRLRERVLGASPQPSRVPPGSFSSEEVQYKGFRRTQSVQKGSVS